jgi:Uma2 family endonuclease
MVSIINAPTQTEVIYPDSDGQPMANNTKQFHWILVIQQNLDWLYADNPNVFVAGDLFWYPVEGKPHIVNAPDVMVVLGRGKADRGSYKQWEEDNIAPQVVFEIISPSNKPYEMERKLVFYEHYGVEEYYIYNPENNHFCGWLRSEDRLDIIPSITSWVSPRLGIRFEPSGDKFEIYRPDNSRFFSYLEISQILEQKEQQLEQKEQQLEQQKQQLEQKEQQLDEVQQRAEESETRSRLFAEKLRSMGINPDDLT